MSGKTLAAKASSATRAEKDELRIARNLAIATEENARLGLPKPWRLNTIWLVPLGGGRVKPVGTAPWRRPKK